MYSARAALSDAATILRAREASLLSNNPKKRRFRLYLDVVNFAVDCELAHPHSPAMGFPQGSREALILGAGPPGAQVI